MRARSPARRRWRVPAIALAASVAAFAFVQFARAPRADIQAQDGGLVARGALARALDRQLASAPDAGAAVEIGLTFRDGRGQVCRSFTTRAGVAGLACRAGDAWTLPVVAQSGPASGEVRRAGTAMPPEVQAAVDARLQGDAFDAAQERAARDAGWR